MRICTRPLNLVSDHNSNSDPSGPNDSGSSNMIRKLTGPNDPGSSNMIRKLTVPNDSCSGPSVPNHRPNCDYSGRASSNVKPYRTVFVSCSVSMAVQGGAERTCINKKGKRLGVEVAFYTDKCADENDCKGNSSHFEPDEEINSSVFSLVGSLRPYSIQLRMIKRLSNRFVSDGKLTVIATNGDQIFISNALESQLLGLIDLICQVNNEVQLLIPKDKLNGLKLPRSGTAAGNFGNCQVYEANGLAARRTRRASVSSQHSNAKQMYDTVQNKNKRVCLGASTPTVAEANKPDVDVYAAVDNNNSNKRFDNRFDSVARNISRRIPPLNRVPEDVLPNILMRCSLSAFPVCCKFALCIRRHRTKLKFVPQRGSNVPPEVICRTIQLSQNLELIDLAGCSDMTSSAIKQLSLTSRLPARNLKVLILRGCWRIQDHALKPLLFRLRRLQVLDLLDCSQLTVNSLLPLQAFKCLRYLAIGTTNTSKPTAKFQGNLLQWILGKDDEYRPNAETICQTPSINDTCLEESVNTPTATIVPSILHCGPGPPPISHLAILRCTALSGLTALCRISSTLTKLDLRGCSWVNDNYANTFGELCNLEVVCLAETSVGDEVVLQLADKCKKLKHLDLGYLCSVDQSGPTQISGSSLEILSHARLGIPTLTRLRIANLRIVGDRILRMLLASFASLEYLDVSDCWEITALALEDEEAIIAAGEELLYLGIIGISVERHIIERQVKRLGCNKCIVFDSKEVFCIPIPVPS